jgi:hypothetical protein
MAKVITFSRKFPTYHPKVGQPTFFVEQVLNSLGINSCDREYIFNLQRWNLKSLEDKKLTTYDLIHFQHSLNNIAEGEKKHTIRNGSRWKAGDKASLRVWFGKPYNSPQIIFAPELEIKQAIGFKMKQYEDDFYIDIGKKYFHVASSPIELSILPSVAINDGLSIDDLLSWFQYPKPFEGQILCWREVHYA